MAFARSAPFVASANGNVSTVRRIFIRPENGSCFSYYVAALVQAHPLSQQPCIRHHAPLPVLCTFETCGPILSMSGYGGRPEAVGPIIWRNSLAPLLDVTKLAKFVGKLFFCQMKTVANRGQALGALRYHPCSYRNHWHVWPQRSALRFGRDPCKRDAR